ncbi:LacI family transcriptional regulator [Enterococcus sp. DIV0840]|uniref:LacI family DNA-binding transcriptional regulator n=1 Tax=Enterococcus TaxID=1350 RepID=UPI001A8F5812|nr:MULTISPECIES: LacI family DNA-binding transcriptional regulator [Enterococcus]MBO0435763.1 LacI family DNA-binding transcriptional regulator [Enterococcus sp. DIV0849a]MBO0475167.1 LacI family DNA-binding transcriptional regulator [Enterococcus ureasiticus]
MVNMNDVAKKANVSRGTVSNYVNHVKIKPELAVRVEKAIEELNYIPNQAARSLKKQESDIIVFILPTIWTPFFSELAYYIQLELQIQNFKMLLCNSQNDYNLELDYIKMAQEQKVKGILTISYSDIEPYLISNIPIVSIERYFNSTIPFITSDNFGGARQAAEELHKRGSKRLLLILRELPNNLGVFERMNGFIDYCTHNELEYEVYLDKGNSIDFPKRLDIFLTEKFSENCPFDGIFTVTDRYAEFVFNAFAHLPWSIPEDVQLVGFDGARSFSNQSLTISTMSQDVREIAHLSVKELVEFDDSLAIQKKHILPVKFTAFKTTRKLDEK